jgi:hypothetical protein
MAGVGNDNNSQHAETGNISVNHLIFCALSQREMKFTLDHSWTKTVSYQGMERRVKKNQTSFSFEIKDADHLLSNKQFITDSIDGILDKIEGIKRNTYVSNEFCYETNLTASYGILTLTVIVSFWVENQEYCNI